MSVVRMYPLGMLGQVHVSYLNENKYIVFTENYILCKNCVYSQKTVLIYRSYATNGCNVNR